MVKTFQSEIFRCGELYNFNIIAVPAMKKMADPAGTLDIFHEQPADLLTAKSVMVSNVPTKNLRFISRTNTRSYSP